MKPFLNANSCEAGGKYKIPCAELCKRLVAGYIKAKIPAANDAAGIFVYILIGELLLSRFSGVKFFEVYNGKYGVVLPGIFFVKTGAPTGIAIYLCRSAIGNCDGNKL